MSRLMLNELSLHEQFQNLHEFRTSLIRVLECRQAAREFRRSLEVRRDIVSQKVTLAHDFRAAVNGLGDRQLLLEVQLWISKDGPFWNEPRVHDANEYFECISELVTDFALAEAAHLCHHGSHATCISFFPSNFTNDPLDVNWRQGPHGDLTIQVRNFTDRNALVHLLETLEPPVLSWKVLFEWIALRCPSLILSNDVATQLNRYPFSQAICTRTQTLLGALEAINQAIINNDIARFNQLRQMWMEGGSNFSDESDTNKVAFGNAMTFSHPTTGQKIFCPWHGKIRTSHFRIHFQWPKGNPADRLLVGYIGPKITKD